MFQMICIVTCENTESVPNNNCRLAQICLQCCMNCH